MTKQKSFSSFNAKVLLFGEHVINKDATGLAIPTSYFSGKFKLSSIEDKAFETSNASLRKLAHYLLTHADLEKAINVNSFLDDIDKGLVFDSNIPQGYGLGSSGALVAALVSAYGTAELKSKSALEIKEVLAKIESCFHGKSSGLDPIVSFLNSPVLVSKEGIKKVKLKKSKDVYFEVGLIDTGKARKTNEWVEKFMNMTKDPVFAELLAKSYIPANELCIDSFLNHTYAHFWKSLKLISQLQYTYMKDFIPRSLWKDWEDGLKYNEYYLKICGAGGGGFMLSFSKLDTKNLHLQTQKKLAILNF